MRTLANGESQLVAALIPNGPLDLPTLAAYCRQKLELLAPANYLLVQDFPRNASGKVIRRELAAQFSTASTA
jgi:acyl-coenzyme A synthetase/AMP-(fatty) acid ligase